MIFSISFALVLHSSFACSCVRISTAQGFESSDYIFVGNVIKGEVRKFEHNGKIEYSSNILFTFKINKMIKGKLKNDEIFVTTGFGYGDCGYPFLVGRKYLVYAGNKKEFNDEEFLSTNICTRTKLFSDKAMWEIEELDRLSENKDNSEDNDTKRNQ